MVQDAVIRNFEIIGEAAKRVPEDYRKEHPQIPWKLMAGFREVLIHAYEGVDVKRVWQIAKRDLPQVKGAIAGILPPWISWKQNWPGRKLKSRNRKNNAETAEQLKGQVSLEYKFQSQLNLPGGAGREDFTRILKVELRHRISEIHVVGRIENLPAELEIFFILQVEIFHEREM